MAHDDSYRFSARSLAKHLLLRRALEEMRMFDLEPEERRVMLDMLTELDRLMARRCKPHAENAGRFKARAR